MELALIKKIGRESKDYFAITLGLILYSLGWALFLLPYQITTGGVTGIAAIIYYATGVEIQISYFLINAVFLGFALKILGPKFSVKTIYAENHLCHLHANLPPLAFPMDTEGRKRKPAPAFRTRPRLYGMCHWSRYVGLRHRYRIL